MLSGVESADDGDLPSVGLGSELGVPTLGPGRRQGVGVGGVRLRQVEKEEVQTDLADVFGTLTNLSKYRREKKNY